MRAMKDSGIEWIGEIPEEWGTIKIKYIATLNGRIGWQGLTSAEYCDEGAYLITGINFENGSINWDTCVHVPMSRWEEAEQIQISEGDLLITKDGTVGKTAIVKNMPGETSLNSGVLLISTNSSCNKGYLYWVLNSEIFWKWFNEINAGNSTIIHLYQYDFKEFSFPLPSLDIQQRIASYLDSKCSKIDNIIAKQQQLIEKLKEYKQAVITEAVTKGLNPDVPMKDSGIEWIGKIPESWSIDRLKHYAISLSKGNGITKDDVVENGNIQCIRYGEIYSKYDRIAVHTVSKTDIERIEVPKYIDTGDILFAGTGELIGEIGKNIVYLGNERCLAGGDIVVMKHKQEPVFMNYALNSAYAQAQKSAGKMKLKVIHISATDLGNIKICVPSLDEQRHIARFLDSTCNAIDSSIVHSQQLITKLQEYKKSLIYEVVTGKCEVPNG